MMGLEPTTFCMAKGSWVRSSLSRSSPLLKLIANRSRRVLWKKFVTGSPVVMSCAPNLPSPWWERAFTAAQFLHCAGIRASATPVTVARAIAHPTTAGKALDPCVREKDFIWVLRVGQRSVHSIEFVGRRANARQRALQCVAAVLENAPETCVGAEQKVDKSAEVCRLTQ
jgi:hypothetical protein